LARAIIIIIIVVIISAFNTIGKATVFVTADWREPYGGY
jgi:hypothetical protein